MPYLPLRSTHLHRLLALMYSRLSRTCPLPHSLHPNPAPCYLPQWITLLRRLLPRKRLLPHCSMHPHLSRSTPPRSLLCQTPPQCAQMLQYRYFAGRQALLLPNTHGTLALSAKSPLHHGLSNGPRAAKAMCNTASKGGGCAAVVIPTNPQLQPTCNSRSFRSPSRPPNVGEKI